jgi:hypothetical protein
LKKLNQSRVGDASEFFNRIRRFQPDALCKYRSFPERVRTGQIDPLPSFPVSTGTGGERQKADVGATGGMRQQRSSLKQAAARASSTQTGHKASHLPSASSTARRDDFCLLET